MTITNRISEENKREMAMACRAEGRDPVAERLARLKDLGTERQKIADDQQAADLAQWAQEHPGWDKPKPRRKATRREWLAVLLVCGAVAAWWGWPVFMRWLYPWW